MTPNNLCLSQCRQEERDVVSPDTRSRFVSTPVGDKFFCLSLQEIVRNQGHSHLKAREPKFWTLW